MKFAHKMKRFWLHNDLFRQYTKNIPFYSKIQSKWLCKFPYKYKIPDRLPNN